MARFKLRSKFIALLAALGAVGGALAVGQSSPPPLAGNPVAAPAPARRAISESDRMFREAAPSSLLQTAGAQSHLARLAGLSAPRPAVQIDNSCSLSLRPGTPTGSNAGANGATGATGTPLSHLFSDRLEAAGVNQNLVVDARD